MGIFSQAAAAAAAAAAAPYSLTHSTLLASASAATAKLCIVRDPLHVYLR